MKKNIVIALPFVVDGTAEIEEFDGITDDLLTGGRGFKGFLEKKPPAFNQPETPTTKDIRTRAIWYNYRALMDLESPCYGRYYGPGAGSGSPDMIAGREIMALSDEGVTMMIQIPRHFDTDHPFLVAVPSSGSRGIYGGIGVVGEWALKRGFAVVYTDKGTGVGYHLLDDDNVILMDGRVMTQELAGDRSPFDSITTSGRCREDILSAHNASWPHRIAVKHAHSGVNLQKNWGRYVLEAITFGRAVLETTWPGIGEKLKVIAAGISNGGLSSIMAKEMDNEGLIDAVAVSEPNVTPICSGMFSIVQGDDPPVTNHSKNLADYVTLFNIYQPCASLSQEMDGAPFRFDAFGMTRAMCEERCFSLKEKGLLSGQTIDDLAKHALSIIRSYAVNKEQEILLPSHYTLDVARSIAVTYISQYACANVLDHMAGFSFAAVDENGHPRALTAFETALLFSDQSGIPPFSIIKLINDHDPNGPCEDRRSTSPSTSRNDMNLDGALRLRRLVTGFDEQLKPLTGEELDLHLQIVKSMEEIKVCGNLRGSPTVIVTGRSDAVLPINHTSRPYVAANAIMEKDNSSLRYYEVTSAHHVDALNMLYKNPETCDSPMDFAPLHVMYIKALDFMVDHLKKGLPLPPSQVIRPTAPYETMPDIEENPLPEHRILFKDNTLFVPE
ncbi:MAG: 3-hydroxybutyrate oligomer hydrolase family protein [Desulfobacteraceae bacterium]|jgi:hydroxybutyrate-dimer hydrolase